MLPVLCCLVRQIDRELQSYIIKIIKCQCRARAALEIQCRISLAVELFTCVQALAQSTSQDVTLPEGYVWYETMLVLRPDLSEEER